MDSITPELRQMWNRRIEVLRLAEQGHQIRLTDWERAFLLDIGTKLEAGEALSFKESSALGRIYARVP